MQNLRVNALSVCLAVTIFISSQLAIASPQQEPASSLGQEAIALQRAYADAREHGNVEFIKNTLADDFTSIEINGDSSGKNDLLRDVHPSERPGPSPILYGFKVVELDDNCFVVTYDAVFPGDRLERYQHLSDTWVKRGSQWKLKFQQSTLNLWSAHDLD